MFEMEAMINQVVRQLHDEARRHGKAPGLIVFIPFEDLAVYQLWPRQEVRFVGFGEN